MHFYTHLLLLLQPLVQWLSIVNFNDDAKPPPKWILREFDVSRIGPRLGGLPHLERLHGKIWPRLRGLPGLADRATRLGGSPHLSCKRDQIKMRDYMNRRVTPPERITSPTLGPPPCNTTNFVEFGWRVGNVWIVLALCFGLVTALARKSTSLKTSWPMPHPKQIFRKSRE